MTVLLKSIKDPARLQWHEVYPEQRLNAAGPVLKVDRYWLRIDALAQPMRVREVPPPYVSGDHSERGK